MVKRLKLDDPPKKKRTSKRDDPQRPATSGSFKPGNTIAAGNKGYTAQARRDKHFITSAIIAGLEERMIDPTTGNASRYIDAIVRRLLKTATLGTDKDSTRAITEILDRTEGKARQSIELTGDKRKPLEIINRQMSPAQASRIYTDMLHMAEDEDEDG